MANVLSQIWAVLRDFQIKDAVDIFIIAMLLYYLFKLFRQSRSGQLVKGLVVLLVAFAVASVMHLTMLLYILKKVFEYAAIILVVIFQPEIRQGLERLGRNKTLKNIVNNPTNQAADPAVIKAIGDVSDACSVFSGTKTGALIVFERDTLLNEIAGTGTILNSDTSPALLGNIFFNKAPLHDGACIIRNGKILAAGCILPLTKSLNVSQSLGTRHRAAIGMSEETDSVIVVVSEETGAISVAIGGKLTRGLSRNQLYDRLSELLVEENQERANLLTSIFKSKKEKNHES